MNYGSTESQDGSIGRHSSITASTTTTTRRRMERQFLLPGIQVFAYSVGHIHNDICSAMWFTYLITFMEKVLNMTTYESGLLTLIGQIADGIATPIVGIESDRNTNACHAYGKRKTWHLIGTILSMFTFPFIFQPCYGGEHASKGAVLFYYSMLIIVFQFAWAAIQINHMSMATDLSPYSCERVKLTARRSSFTVISNILVFLFFWLVMHFGNYHKDMNHDEEISPSDAGLFRFFVISLVALGIGFSIFFHIFVREKPHNVQIKRENDDANSVDYSNRLNHLQWNHWFKFKIFYQVASLYMVSRLIVNLTQVFIPLYLQFTLHLSKESIAYVPLVIYCSGFVGSILVEKANKKYSNLQIFVAGAVISLISFIWVFLGTSENYRTIYIFFVSVLIGLSGQTININSQSVLNDMIGQNTASSAFVFGAMSFLDKFSNGSFIMLIQIMRHSKTSTTEGPFIRHVLSMICGGSSIAIILIIFSLASHNFDDDLSRSRLNKSRSTYVSSVNVASDSNYPIRESNNLIDCANGCEDEERSLISTLP